MTAFNYEMMAALLRETEQEHAKVEKSLPKHDWQDWYAAYMVERMEGEQFTREFSAYVATNRIRDSATGVTIIDGTEKRREDFIESQT